jgi:ATP-dependent HslUV protease ATP-binding subunit HslU
MTNIQKPRVENSGSLTPCAIVEYLNRYIIGQDSAKKAVAIALRNRWRRLQLPPEVADEIIPKNILIIGPTGVGKTEIARRIAKLTQSPFIKVEASKYTEVGYVGRDVESMIRDLTEISVNMVKSEHRLKVRTQAEKIAEERLLDLLIPPPPPPQKSISESEDTSEYSETFILTQDENGNDESNPQINKSYLRTREKFRTKLRNGKLEDKMIEIEVKEVHGGLIEVFSSSGIEEIGMQIKDMIPGVFNPRKKRRKLTIEEARRVITEEEEDRLVDMDKVVHDAIKRVENSGIIFIDEIDKVAGRESSIGPDVSREGVQRDLLPIIEGSTVSTKYGIVKTDHILFIGAGAFTVSKPSDLIPELQGRFPVKIDVHSLTRDQMRRILEEPENALTKQYQSLLSTEEIILTFTPESLNSIAALAEDVNKASEDIGARRLHTIMEHLLEHISFHAPDLKGQQITITESYVAEHVTIQAITLAENIRKKIRPGFL